MGASWAVLGPSWAILGPPWGSSWAQLGRLGPSWGALEAILCQEGRHAKTRETTNGCPTVLVSSGLFYRGLLGSRGPLGGLLEPSLAVLGFPLAVWKPWGVVPGPSMSRLRAVFGRPGPSCSRLGPSCAVLPELGGTWRLRRWRWDRWGGSVEKVAALRAQGPGAAYGIRLIRVPPHLKRETLGFPTICLQRARRSWHCPDLWEKV